MRDLNQYRFLIQSLYLQKRHPDRVSGRTLRWFVSHGWRGIISWLFTRWWQGHHHPMDGLTEIVVGDAAVRDRGRWRTWAMAGCCDNVYDLLTSVNGSPNGKSASCVLYRKIRMRVTRMTMRAMFTPLNLSTGDFRACNSNLTSSDFHSTAASSVRADDAHEKSTDKLSVKKFRDRFCIPNSVIVDFLNEGEDVGSTEKAEGHAMTFSKEQFNAGLRSLFRHCSRNSFTFPRFHQPSSIPTSSGREKMTSLACRSPALPSIGDGAARIDEGRAKGHMWSGAHGRGEALCDAAHCTELNGRRLGVPGVCVNILPRKLPKEVVLGEHYVLKDLPIYQEVKEADAEKRRALLDDKEKRKNEGTLRKTPDRNAA
ncbi:hypothetical protein CK203_026038 [Vitis vinifera]|uniref:Uncharacterized protein n=1 Tax=Vitis vinifera TaxID=29760 RepID=A0A438IJ81_VITVI|nr:hypothetical protein CK203_026038 [Vitis vinifera]